MCYADEYITIKYADTSSVLFAGIIKGLKFHFNFSSDNIKENNTIECSFLGIVECRYYPFHILEAFSEECEGLYNNVYEDKSVDFTPGNISQHTFRFEKSNGEVLFTAKLLKNTPKNWFETIGGIRRPRPPYDLLSHEKTQGIGYAENIYFNPIKQLIAASLKGNYDIHLTFDFGDWYYVLEEYISYGKLTYPDGRIIIVENTNNDNFWYGKKLFQPNVVVKDYVELLGKKIWYVAEYAQTSNDNKADATIIFQNDCIEETIFRFEGSFIRQSVARVEKIPSKTRGYIAYYRLKGVVYTIGRNDNNISEKESVDLYNDETVLEAIAVSSSKHETFTLVDKTCALSNVNNITTPMKSIGIDDLIGLDKVKQTFEEFRKFGEYRRMVLLHPDKKDDDRLLALFNHKVNINVIEEVSKDSVSLHMIFLGNPGTGKTTVAERIAFLLKDFNLVVTNEIPLIVVRSDLVGKYIGHTEEIVRKKIEEAMGRVLVVDEAHTLFETDSGNDFGRIALNELMYAMEQHRDQLVVILAGYTDEMLYMLKNANPGLASRFPWYFYFDDHSVEELWEILCQKVEKNGYRFDANNFDSIKVKALDCFTKLKKDLDGIKEGGRTKYLFGNGRGVRTFFQYMQIGLAVRLNSEQDNHDDLHILTMEEIGYAYDTFMKSTIKLIDRNEIKSRIGFGSSHN